MKENSTKLFLLSEKYLSSQLSRFLSFLKTFSVKYFFRSSNFGENVESLCMGMSLKKENSRLFLLFLYNFNYPIVKVYKVIQN